MNRPEIEAHPLYPFTDFRRNDASFLLLELYWPAVIASALGRDLTMQVVPLAEADRDPDGFGNPALLHFWIPRRGRGLRILYNDPPEALGAEAPHIRSPLYMAASLSERPEPWDLPTGGQIPGPVHAMEELVCIADTSLQVADAVHDAARLFFRSKITLAEMQEYCDLVEKAWAVR